MLWFQIFHTVLTSIYLFSSACPSFQRWFSFYFTLQIRRRNIKILNANGKPDCSSAALYTWVVLCKKSSLTCLNASTSPNRISNQANAVISARRLFRGQDRSKIRHRLYRHWCIGETRQQSFRHGRIKSKKCRDRTEGQMARWQR